MEHSHWAPGYEPTEPGHVLEGECWCKPGFIEPGDGLRYTIHQMPLQRRLSRLLPGPYATYAVHPPLISRN